jgi:transposase
MVKSLSEDLRERVIAAVEAGASRRQAAARFGVSATSAIRWMQAWLQQGRTAPRRQGGDRRSGRIEGEADFLLAQIETTPDLTLVEIQALLKERGVSVSYGSLWRFFDRHQITFKKKRRMPPNRSDLT